MAPAPNTRSRLVLAICFVTALYWLALFVATHVPMRRRPETAAHKDFDKGEHLAAFAGLALLLCTTGVVLGQPLSRLFAIVLAIVAGYGAIDEVTQLLVPTRAADLRDWLADIAGGLAGIIAFGLAWTVMLAFKGRRAAVRAG